MADAASFASLSNELLIEIFDFVIDAAPAADCALATVCKRFHAVVNPLLHRQKTFDFGAEDDDAAEKKLDRCLQHPDVLRGLRYLTVRGTVVSTPRAAGNHDGYANTDNRDNRGEPTRRCRMLMSFLQRVQYFKTLTWECDSHIPPQILQVLETHHKEAELRIVGWTRDDRHAGPDVLAEVALAKCPALVALSARMRMDNSPHMDLRELAFRRIVASAPNLRSVSLIKYRPDHRSWLYMNLADPETQFRSWDFPVAREPNPSVRMLTLDGLKTSADDMDEWSHLVDMSKLETLKFVSNTAPEAFFEWAPGKLPQLQSLSLNLASIRDWGTKLAAGNYIATCSPLRSLSLWSWGTVVKLPRILAQHGRTLRILQLHDPERYHTDNLIRRVFSADEIEAIGSRCPNLCDFTLDMNRATPELDLADYATTAAALNRLNMERLQIYFDRGLTHVYEQVTGYVFHSTAMPLSTEEDMERLVAQLWRAIYGERRVGDRALDVKFGEWERKQPLGDISGFVHMGKPLWRLIKARPHERDDHVGECQITTLQRG